MPQLPIKLPLDLMQTRWASVLNPVLALPILSGIQLSDIFLAATVATPINHLLSRLPQGWLVTDINAAANVWRVSPFNKSTLVLKSDIDVTISLWVF